MTLNELITRHKQIKQEKAELNVKLSALEKEQKQIGYELLNYLNDHNQIACETAAGKVVRTENTFPKIDDWEEALRWIFESENTQLVRRQLNATAFRELLNTGVETPGLSKVTVYDVTVR